MPQGQVVGRISVRVFPDTDSYRKDAQKQLDKIEKQLKVTVPTKVDLTGAKRDLLQGIRAINAENKTKDSRKIRLYTTISMAGMKGEISRAVREYNNAAKNQKVRIKTQLDATEVDLKISDSSLRKMTDDLKDWRDRNSPLKIDLELNWPSTASAALSARLAYLTRPRTVSIIPTLNNAALAKVAASLAALSGIRVLNNLFEKFSNILRDLDKNVPIIGTLATAIAGLAGWGLTAASNLFALSASLAQIGPTVALLPGLLGGMVVGLGVTIAAFKDFNKVLPEVKKQLSELQDIISDNFWEKAKAPIQELVNSLLPQFSAGVEKTATQLGNFFGGFAISLKDALGPALTQMFDDLASSIDIATGGTNAFANIIATLGKVGTSYLPSLAQWFVNISTQFSDFLTAKGENGIKAEIDEGIAALKDLGGVLYNTHGILSGIAAAATEAGGSSLATLNDTLKSIHSTVDSDGFQNGLTNVFSAAHQAMQQIATISGPAVENLFITIGHLLTALLPQVGAIIGTVISAVAGALAQPEVFNGVIAMFNGLLNAVVALAPAMAPLGQALGALMEVIGAFATALGPLVAAALVPVANAFTALVPSITPFIQLLTGALTQAITALTPILAALVPIVGEALGAAFNGLSAVMPTIISAFTQVFAAVGPLIGVLVGALAPILPIIAQLFGQIFAALAPLVAALASALAPILPVLAAAFQTVLTALQPIIAVALQIITAVITPLLPMLGEIIQSFLPPLADAIKRVFEAIQPLLDALLAVVNFLMPVLVPAIQFVIEILAGSLVAAVNGVALVFEGLAEIFKGAWDIIVGVLKIAWGIIKGIFTGDFSTLADGWNQLWSGIWSFVKGIWDTIVGAFAVFLNVGILGVAGKIFKGIGAAFKAGWAAVKGFGEAAWAAIRSAFGSFGSTLSGLGSSMMSRLGSLISSGWTAIKSAASSAMSALGRAVATGVTNVVKFVRELPGKARSALGNLGSTLISAGKKLIQGFINGITSMFGSVKGKLSDLTNKLKDWKGPESLDRVLLVGAGQLVIDGFIQGLESRYDAVRKSLSGLTDDVAGTDFDIPGVGQIGAARGISSALTAALAGSEGGGTTKVLNYYAAPGSSLGSEEDLFSAASRARFGW